MWGPFFFWFFCFSVAGLVHNDYTITGGLFKKKGCLSISFRWSNDRFLWQPNCENTSGGPMRYEQLSQPPKVNDSIKKEGMKPTIPEVEGFFCWVFAVRSCLVFASYPLFHLIFCTWTCNLGRKCMKCLCCRNLRHCDVPQAICWLVHGWLITGVAVRIVAGSFT